MEPGQEALLDTTAGDILRAIGLAGILSREIEIFIIGHTDPRGGEEMNRKIGRIRGERIFQLLVSRKIPAHYLSHQGGEVTSPLRERVVSFTVAVKNNNERP